MPQGFPSELSDDELKDAVRDLVNDGLRDRYGDNVGSWLPELQLALLSVAVSDQARRELVGSSRIAIGSLIVAAIALAVALISLLVS